MYKDTSLYIKRYMYRLGLEEENRIEDKIIKNIRNIFNLKK